MMSWYCDFTVYLGEHSVLGLNVLGFVLSDNISNCSAWSICLYAAWKYTRVSVCGYHYFNRNVKVWSLDFCWMRFMEISIPWQMSRINYIPWQTSRINSNSNILIFFPQDEALRRAIEVSLQEAMAQNQQQQQQQQDNSEAGEDDSFLPPELRNIKSHGGERARRRHDSGNRGKDALIVLSLVLMTHCYHIWCAQMIQYKIASFWDIKSFL